MKILAFVLAVSAMTFTHQTWANDEDALLLEDAKSFFSPLPDSLIDAKKNAALIELGHKLYMEPKMSKSGTISCNSCHKLDAYGVDNEPTSPGHDGTRGDRNSPTVYNAGLHTSQFWDGRAKDLAEQALGPILNPVEHGLASEAEAVAAVSTDDYSKMFKTAFPSEKNPLTFINIGKAIEAFEKTLLTPSRFDDFLKGDTSALTAQEKRGLGAFLDANCASCHSGPALGGTMYRKMGFVKEYPKVKDTGRFQVTNSENDKHVFKVPGLRNIEKTAPYFHDGSVATLEEAIAIMGEYQAGVTLSPKEIEDIKAFLGSLTAKKLPY